MPCHGDCSSCILRPSLRRTGTLRGETRNSSLFVPDVERPYSFQRDFLLYIIIERGIAGEQFFDDFLFDHKRTLKNCIARSRSTEERKPLHETKRPYSAPTFAIVPMSWSKTIRSIASFVDFTCTQIFGEENPRLPAEARMSTPWSGPFGLT